mmetsp:Transcript_145669/g.271258  ORF Transcript_145669/g.271258 Transcript_145669/m.271258 type:complete len:243 (-) Transcript_145669:735-1463(-)
MRVWPSWRTCPARDCSSSPWISWRVSWRRRICDTSCFTSPSLSAMLVSALCAAATASSTSPSNFSPPTTFFKSARLFCNSPKLGAAASLLPVSFFSFSLLQLSAPGGTRRTQISPSLHASSPRGVKVALNVSPSRSVEMELLPQISSSESAPQCHVIVVSLMTHRGCESSSPTHVPSKALQSRMLRRSTPCSKTDFICGSARTSSAFSRKLSTTVFASFDSHSSHSFDAISTASVADAVSFS